MRYRYRGYSKKGERVKGTIEAATLEEAKSRLLGEGIVYEKINAVKTGFTLSFKREIPKEILIEFSKTLAVYLKSGIPLSKALHLAKNRFEQRRAYEFVFMLQRGVDEGKSFHQALEAQNIYKIPPFYKEAVKIAEESGALDRVVSEMGDFVAGMRSIEEKSKRALIYPAFILVVSLLLISFMLSFVIPKISRIFDQMNQQLPPVTVFVIETGDFFRENWPFLGFSLVAAVMLFIFLNRRSKIFRYAKDKAILYMPFVGDMAMASDLGRFSYLMYVLSNSGVNFVHASKLASESLQNEVLKSYFKRASSDIVEGKRLSAALASLGFDYDRSFVQSVALAEETSEITKIFENLSKYYKEKNEAKIELFLSMLEPVMILIVGALVGFVVTAMLLPIFSMNAGI